MSTLHARCVSANDRATRHRQATTAPSRPSTAHSATAPATGVRGHPKGATSESSKAVPANARASRPASPRSPPA